MEHIIKEHTPVSLTFGHGDLLPGEVDRIRCEILTEIACPQNVAKVVTMSDSNDDLFVGNADNSNLCDNFIAIRNKVTNSVRFFPVDNFFMSPYRGQNQCPVTSESDTRSLDESFNELNKFMGSKKSKNRLAAAERNAANLSNLNKTVSAAIQSNNSTIESSASSSPVSSIDYLPPCDRNATDIENAYKLYDLVSKDILDSLDTIAREALKMDYILMASDSRFSSFMMKAISHFPKDLRSYKLMIFVDRLLAFNKSPPRLMTDKSNSFCSFSEAVHEKLIEDFSVLGLGNRRLRTPAMRDKILCYAMILIMMGCEYKIDIGMLADIVSPAEHKRLPLLLRALGAKSARSSPSIFKLKAPIGEASVMKNKRPSNKINR